MYSDTLDIRHSLLTTPTPDTSLPLPFISEADGFGIDLIIWVFNGRRSVHYWACDTKARQQTFRLVLPEL